MSDFGPMSAERAMPPQICIVENGGNVLCFGYDANVIGDLCSFINDDLRDPEHEVSAVEMWADRLAIPTAFDYLVNREQINSFYQWRVGRANFVCEKGGIGK